ncbi:MAG TPA: hypothetical protein VHW24_01985 [Bryobacteraceae bacterium]|nr:hypothetical protein [Bryobacteraceae bacterium]
MQFLDNRSKVRLSFGIHCDGQAFLSMNGTDGKNRIELALDQFDKPSLAMSDERWQGRLALGFVAPDTIPYGNWDEWGILFRQFGSGIPVVGLGTMNISGGRTKAFLRILGKNIR